eukprot:16780-Pyramimonas_sp.AAC.1
MRAALRREPHFENDPPSIREAGANIKYLNHKWRGSLRRNARPTGTSGGATGRRRKRRRRRRRRRNRRRETRRRRR